VLLCCCAAVLLRYCLTCTSGTYGCREATAQEVEDFYRQSSTVSLSRVSIQQSVVVRVRWCARL